MVRHHAFDKALKKILIDPGDFYTKVYVLIPAGERGNSNSSYAFYGRNFFPTLVSEASATGDKKIYYEDGNSFYNVGYDCSGLTLDQTIKELNVSGVNTFNEYLILKKVIFDYADNNDEIEIDIVIDIPFKLEVFKEIREKLDNTTIELRAFRGYDKRNIVKSALVKINLVSAGDAVSGFLKNLKKDFKSALFIDIGYKKTKVYLVNCQKGVELFKFSDLGISIYYEKILNLFSEKNIKDIDFFWLVKQVELCCEQLEVKNEREKRASRIVRKILRKRVSDYDISLVLENVRWDLNKDFRRLASDILTSHYTNTTMWVDILVVTGGGAFLNGDILCTSLVNDGYFFSDIYIDKLQPYTVLEGMTNELMNSE